MLTTDYTPEEQKTLREQDPFLNVRDEFRGKSVEEVKSILNERKNPLQLAFFNALRDFNFSGIIRAVNAFGCDSIVYGGHRRFDRRGTVGSHHYTDIYHIDDVELLKLYIELKKQDGFTFVVAESDVYTNSIDLVSYEWNENSILMLGEEGLGVDQEFIDMADDIVYIKQFGSVRSMNVCATAHIFIYDYLIKTGRL
jgi:tRNA G18 (ribose-2'-O)-methylase SpoU